MMDCIDDCTEEAELCQLGSSVMVVREGALGRVAALARDFSPLVLFELDFRGITGEHFGDGVDRRSGCSNGLT